MIVVRLPWPDKRLSPNAREHYYDKSEIVRAHRETAWAATLEDGTRVSAESAPGKAWVRRTPCENVTETLLRNPAGQSRPAKAGDQPEPSVAWYGGNPGCEAYTGSVRAV